MHLLTPAFLSLLVTASFTAARTIDKITLNIDVSAVEDPISINAGRIKCPIAWDQLFTCAGDKKGDNDDGDGDDDGHPYPPPYPFPYPPRPRYHRTAIDCEDRKIMSCEARGSSPKVIAALEPCTLEETVKYCGNSGACECL